jgi:hypothetical protein
VHCSKHNSRARTVFFDFAANHANLIRRESPQAEKHAIIVFERNRIIRELVKAVAHHEGVASGNTIFHKVPRAHVICHLCRTDHVQFSSIILSWSLMATSKTGSDR